MLIITRWLTFISSKSHSTPSKPGATG